MTMRRQFLYRIRPVRLNMLAEGPTPEEANIVADHFRYLQALVERNVVFLAGRTLNDDASAFGIVIFAASTEAEAIEIMTNDPAVAGGVMAAELFPYRIALWADQGPGNPP
jgi:uncharacterized protein YciI